MSKPKVAFFDFTSCEGCQLTVVDSLQTHVDLLDAVEIVQFREAMTERGEDYIIAFIEGSCVRKSDEDRLKKIREQAVFVVALGACAHLGGVNAIRNRQPVEKVTDYVYGESPDWTEPQPYRRSVVRDDLLRVTPLAQPIEAIIPVDVVLPGCPIDREEFVRVTKQLLQGRIPKSARLSDVRRVQVERERVHVPSGAGVPWCDHARRLRRDLPDLRRSVRRLPGLDPQSEPRRDPKRSVRELA